ncbi:hypothetical protein GCM10023189_12480 [Nibrella saemangeumensis]|uniref:Lipocalin-like domain-containing protein n=1 Tax=Nibrella saemangeumensis TaxID=1084526 RepID=A0ABP8MKK1_9BACT
MKKLVVLLFVALSLGACKETTPIDPQPEPAPEKPAATNVIGSYKISSFRFANKSVELSLPTLPMVQGGKTVASGTVVLKQYKTKQVDLLFSLKREGYEDIDFTLDALDVKAVGKVYGIYLEGDHIADADGSNIIFDMSDYDQRTKERITLTFVAKK